MDEVCYQEETLIVYYMKYCGFASYIIPYVYFLYIVTTLSLYRGFTNEDTIGCICALSVHFESIAMRMAFLNPKLKE